jgi:hypothetical protein
MNATLRNECEAACAAIVDRCLLAAKRDPAGLFWTGQMRRGAAAGETDLTLRSGTPGILVFLAAYFEATRDPRIPEFLAESVAWVLTHAEAAPARHGFYDGFGGLVYALDRVRAIAPDAVRSTPRIAAWTERLAAEEVTGTPPLCGLGRGLAGTLLGFGPHAASDDALRARLEVWLRRVVASARPSRAGACWDEPRFRVQPGLGFLQGISGVRFALAQLVRPAHDDGVAWLREAADAHIAAQFDAHSAIWPDHVNEAHFASSAVLATLQAAAAKEDRTPFAARSENVDWSDGAAGILLGRLGTTSQPGTRTTSADFAAAHAALVARLAHDDFSKASFSLDHGLGGIALSLAHLGANDPGCAAPDAIDAIATAAVARQRRWAEGDLASDERFADLGLLSGQTGIGYFLLLVSRSEAPRRSVLHPLAAGPAPLGPLTRDACFRLISYSRAPLTANALNTVPVEIPAQLRFETLHDAWVAAVKASEPRLEPVFAFEWEKTSAMERLECAHYLDFRKHHVTIAHRERLATLSDDELRHETLITAAEVSVAKAPFEVDSQGRLLVGQGREMLMAIELTSRGVMHRRLLPLTYAILGHLLQPMNVSDLLKTLRVKYPSLATQLGTRFESTLLVAIRQCLQSGYLQPQPAGWLRTALAAPRRWLRARQVASPRS